MLLEMLKRGQRGCPKDEQRPHLKCLCYLLKCLCFLLGYPLRPALSELFEGERA